MNTEISKDWFAYVLSRFVAFEMDEEERQKFIERLISSWMYTNKNWNLYEVSTHLNLPHFGEPITKLESNPFWEKELNNIK